MATVSRAQETPRGEFVGANSCSSSLCHGGAGEKSRQFTVWSREDVHARASATLVTARAARIADVLKLGDATKSDRCTSCHTPLAEVVGATSAAATYGAEGVSCESCHGAAGGWLRAHTRMDLGHKDRVQSGMRDLNNLYVRANSCVACHETVDRDLIVAGHPELIFEMDGQAVSEPRHWTEKGEFEGPQAWMIGQAVALREMSWQLSREKVRDDRVTERWQGLGWLMQKVESIAGQGEALPEKVSTADADTATQMKWAADHLARTVAEMSWSEKETRQCLSKLAHTAAEFRDHNVSRMIQARRAELLALGLDRLTLGLGKDMAQKYDPEVKEIFRLVQSLPDFDPDAFAKALESLGEKVGK